MPAYTIIVIYLLSGIAGWLLAAGFVTLLYRDLDKRTTPDPHGHHERLLWVPALVGVFERLILTTLVIWAPKLIVGFIAGWMALKVAGGWGLLKEATLRNRTTNAISLLGSVVSLGWAIAVGLYFHPSSLAVISASN